MPMGDVLFTIRADASQAQKEVLDTAKTVGVLQNATAEQKREFARLENETTDVAQAMRRLKTEVKDNHSANRRFSQSNKIVSKSYLEKEAAAARAAVTTRVATKEEWDATEASRSRALAMDASERQLEQMNDATRRYTTQTRRATTQTNAFRASQGRLATNIRNNRTILYALGGLIGFGGAGFIGQVTEAARESDNLGRTLKVSSAALFENSLEYGKINKTLTDYRNVLTNIRVAQSKAVEGNETLADVFEKAGVSAEELKRIKIDELYDRMKEAVDAGILSVSDLDKFLRKESIPTFQQVGIASDDLTDKQVENAAKVERALQDLYAEAKKGAVAVISIAVDTSDLTPGWLRWIQENLLGGEDPFSPGNFEDQNFLGNPFGRYAARLFEGYDSSRDVRARGALTEHDLYAGGLLDGSAYSVGARGGRGFAENTRGYLRALPSRDSAGGGGGGGSSRDLEAISEAAFNKALMLGGREAFKWAIENSRFELAEEEARSLFDLATAAAQLEETAGEQFLAQLEAALDLQGRLTEISDAEQQILDAEQDLLDETKKLRAEAYANSQAEIAAFKESIRQSVTTSNAAAFGVVGGLLGGTEEGLLLDENYQIFKREILDKGLAQAFLDNQRGITTDEERVAQEDLVRQQFADVTRSLVAGFTETALAGGTPIMDPVPVYTPAPIQVEQQQQELTINVHVPAVPLGDQVEFVEKVVIDAGRDGTLQMAGVR